MRDLIRSFAATAIIQIANIASGVLLARILLPVGRGELAAAMLWPSVIAGVGLLGLSEATAYVAARRTSRPGHIFAASLTLAILLSVILLPIGWIVIDRIAAGFSPAARTAAFLYLGFIPLNFVGLVVGAMHQGSLSITRWNILRVSVHVVYPMLVVLLYLVGWANVLTLALAMLAANAALIVIGLLLARGRAWFDARPRWAEMRALLSFGLRLHVANAVSMLGERSDQLVISLLLPPADLGLYVVAGTVARGAGAIGDTFAVLAFPKVAHADGVEAQAAVAGRYARSVLLLSAIAAAAGIALAPWLIATVFGADFASSVTVTQILLVSIVPLNVKTVLAAVLKGANRGLEVGYVQGVTLVISVLLLGGLLPTLGLKGAAVAALVTQTAAAAMLACRIRHRLDIPFADFLFPKRSDVTLAGLFTRS